MIILDELATELLEEYDYYQQKLDAMQSPKHTSDKRKHAAFKAACKEQRAAAIRLAYYIRKQLL